MTTEVLADSLGLCEHGCGTLLTLEDLPAEAMDAKWQCPSCQGEISCRSFGYKQVESRLMKVLWLNQNKKWSPIKPSQSFRIGNFEVVPQAGAPLYW